MRPGCPAAEASDRHESDACGYTDRRDVAHGSIPFNIYIYAECERFSTSIGDEQ